jgi:signal recognition particle receptor subunit beta
VREIATRIVYWGPSGSGKTETFRAIATRLDPATLGPLVTPEGEGGRTLFLDLLTVEMGALEGLPVRLHLVGLPGDSRLNENALAVMPGADGFVFVADSSPERQAQNKSSLESLRRHLVAIGESELPIVLQFNRRDIPGAVPTERMATDLGAGLEEVQWFETNALDGSGVIETLTAIAVRVVRLLSAAAEERSTT